MKVIIPLDFDGKNICVSFGRAPSFMLYDTENDVCETFANPAAEAQGGAGIKAAQFAVDKGAGALITMRCGENAAAVLGAAGVAIYGCAGTDALGNAKAFKENRLKPLTSFHAGFHGRGRGWR